MGIARVIGVLLSPCFFTFWKHIKKFGMKTVTHFTLLFSIILTTPPCFGQSPIEDFKKFVWEKSHIEIKSVPDSVMCEVSSIPKELIVCEWNLKEIELNETKHSLNLSPLIIPTYKETEQEYILGDESLDYLGGVRSEKSTGNDKEFESKNILSVYLNTGSKFLTIRLNENILLYEKITVELFNLNGQCCYSEILNIGTTIDISYLPVGVYVVRATTSKSNIYYSKVLVK